MTASATEAAAAPRETRPPQPAPRSFARRERPSRRALLGAPVRWPRPSALEASLRALAGAGPKACEAAKGAGLRTLGDLLWHVPHRYRNRSAVIQIGELALGKAATVLVTVRGARVRPTRRRGLRIVEAEVSDGSGSMRASWFNQVWVAERLTPDTRVLLEGRLERRGFRVEGHEFLGEGQPSPDAEGGARGMRGARLGERPPPGIHTTGLVAVHPLSEGLRPQRLREWIWQAAALLGHAPEPLPARLRTERRFPSAPDALAAVHFPSSEAEVRDARSRLAFEELFLYQAALAARRRRRQSARRAPGLGGGADAAEEWIGSLPFSLTADQRRAIAEIDEDLRSTEPMQRLLMGEVGSGKTVIALYAMLQAAEAGYQAVLMAPTETLAEQHAATLDALLQPFGRPFALISGATGGAERRATLGRLASGELGLLVGTHALIEPGVRFARLAVCVVDEQHRFGVRQRAALDRKGPEGMAPHVLHMTATPIPRTLSLTAYGDLDASVLRELPAGRAPVKTWLVEGEAERPAAYEFIRERLREGRQAYVVCPLVSESEKLQARAASEEAARLAGSEFRDFEVGVLHGQMPAAAKQAAMRGFKSGATDVLVATSVIEVGIDVANASVMLIEGAERYGVSQLHQLRGRVGRGPHPSQCILLAGSGGELARARLEAVAAERDGFKLAEVDLSLRGEGEVLGTRQHGLPRFSVASLPRDTTELLAARDAVASLLRRHGSLAAPELGPLLEAARRRFGDEAQEPIAA